MVVCCTEAERSVQIKGWSRANLQTLVYRVAQVHTQVDIIVMEAQTHKYQDTVASIYYRYDSAAGCEALNKPIMHMLKLPDCKHLIT